MRTLRILGVDDHEVVRLGIRAVLKGHHVLESMLEAADGREALGAAARIGPDLVILDLGMRRLEWYGSRGSNASPECWNTDLVLTDSDSECTMRKALEIGVRGFLLSLIQAAISWWRLRRCGRTFLTSRLTDRLLDGYLKADCDHSEKSTSVPGLTTREREVIQLLAEGSSTREVASILGFHSVSELVLYAVWAANSRRADLPPRN